MARTLTVKDAHVIMNLLVKQATGQANLTVTDTSSFISAGETVLATGMENVINSLNIVLGRTLVAARPYNAKLALMDAENTGVYSSRMRKISFYAKNALASGEFNTDLFTNLKEGFTNGQNATAEGLAQSTKSQWEQHQPVALEMNFGGSSTWQDCITTYETQLQAAFRSEADFASFVAGYMTEHANDIESQREAWNRMILLNKIAGVYDMSADMPGSVINLTEEYNNFYNTNYTSEELRSEQLPSFLAFMAATIKEVSQFMTERSAKYHWSPAKTVDGVAYTLLRHTPYDKQRLYLYAPLFNKAEALVLPTIFRPEYLDIKKQYEAVTYWQSQASRASINVTPAIVDTATGTQKAGTAVSIPYVVGMITDVDGMMTNFQLESARTTPVEARKGYRNTWNTFLRNGICDPTENCVIFVMED